VPHLLHDALDHGRVLVRSRQRALGRLVAGPGRERDLLAQVVKSAFAAVLAWETARVVLDSPQPFFAPLAALVTVHVTVYGSLRVAAQRVAAVVVGVLLAYVAARYGGVNALSLGVVLVAALLLGRWRRLGGEGLQVAVTALMAMTVASGTAQDQLRTRVLDTVVGAVLGAVVNLLVLPPVHLRSARRSVAEVALGVGRLLRAVGDGLRGEWGPEDAQEWHDRASRLDRLVREARATTDQGRESVRLNPRRQHVGPGVTTGDLSRAVDSLEHVAIQCRGITTTLRDLAESPRRPTARFLSTYADVLLATADAFDTLGDETQGDEELAGVRSAVRRGGDRWRELRDLVQRELDRADALPAYGSLLADVERVLDELQTADGALAVSTP
jgi:hypothetical protein